MDQQDIFTRVWEHLNRQGRPAMGDDCCQYRTANGMACAVGCLLDDETAHRLDASIHPGIVSIAEDDIDEIPAMLRPHIPFLETLQVAHDCDTSDDGWLHTWRSRMARIANRHKLTVPPIPT